MSTLFIEAFNALLQRYHFAVTAGIRKESARYTLLTGIEHARSLAYSCEDIDSAIELQRKYESLRDEGAIPQPI